MKCVHPCFYQRSVSCIQYDNAICLFDSISWFHLLKYLNFTTFLCGIILHSCFISNAMSLIHSRSNAITFCQYSNTGHITASNSHFCLIFPTFFFHYFPYSFPGKVFFWNTAFHSNSLKFQILSKFSRPITHFLDISLG